MLLNTSWNGAVADSESLVRALQSAPMSYGDIQAANFATGILSTKKLQPVESSLIISNAQAVSGLATETWQTIISREQPFYWVRIGLLNSIAGTITVDKTAVAVADTFNNANPKVGGADPPWVNVTWNGGSTSVALPAGTAANPSLTFSDWVPIKSVAWAGAGNPRCLLYVRNYIAATGAGYINAGNTYVNNVGGRIFFGSPMAGDKIASPLSYVNALPGYVLPVIAETRGYNKVVRVAGVGDSIYEGSSGLTLGRASAWGPTGAAAASLIKPSFSYDNFGIAGQTTTQSLARVPGIIASALKPDVMVYQYYSPNDGIGSTQSKMDTAIGNALSFVAQCMDANILPVIATAAPVNGQNAPDSAMRAAGDAFIRSNAAVGGWRVFDMAAALTDPTLANFQPYANTYFDSYHPNDAGEALAASAFSSCLQTLY
jgi:lysophospholipase L1-like esterase